jgi:phage-related holin
MKNHFGEIAVFLSAFFLPILPAMIATGALLSIDTLTGILKARKKKESISSEKLKAVVAKSIVYLSLIITGNIIELYMIPAIPLVKVCIGMVAMIELKSIAENASDILGFDVLKELIKRIKKK